ncbi:hypothetical protein AB0M44_19425 [Streptosporangium subroseum]
MKAIAFTDVSKSYQVAGQCSGLQAGALARAGGLSRPERALIRS